MAFSYSSQDVRLYAGGTRVHGWDDDSRTLTSVEMASTFHTLPRTAIGDMTDREIYAKRQRGTLNVSGFYDDEYGLQPVMERAVARQPLPITYSTRGGSLGGASVVSEESIWKTFPVSAPNDQLVSLSGECCLTNWRGALCIGENQYTGVFSQNVGGNDGLELATRTINIRQTTPRLELISGGNAFLFQIPTADSDRYVRVGDDIAFVGGGIAGTFRITTIAGGAQWQNITVERVPRASLSGISTSARNQVTGFRILDTYSGERITSVHVSNVVKQDATKMLIQMQGRLPGSAAWTDLGSHGVMDLTVSPIPDAGFWLDVPSSTRGLNRIRVQARFRTGTGAEGTQDGGRGDYSAFIRADHVPRVVHH